MSDAVAEAQRRAVEAIRRHGARHVEFEEPPLSSQNSRERWQVAAKAADFAITSVRRAQTAAAVKICELLGVTVPELPSGRRASTRRRSAYPTRPPSRSVG